MIPAGMVFGLWACDFDSSIAARLAAFVNRVPSDIAPLQGQVLGRATQATVAAQGKQQFPLRIRASVNHLLCHIAGNEEHPRFVHLASPLNVGKRIFAYQLPLDGQLEHLPGNANATAHGGIGQRLAWLFYGLAVNADAYAGLDCLAPPVGFFRADVPQIAFIAEELNQVLPGVVVCGLGCRLHVDCLAVFAQERGQPHSLPCPVFHQPHGGKPAM